MEMELEDMHKAYPTLTDNVEFGYVVDYVDYLSRIRGGTISISQYILLRLNGMDHQDISNMGKL